MDYGDTDTGGILWTWRYVTDGRQQSTIILGV